MQLDLQIHAIMRKLLLIIFCLLLYNPANSQITILKKTGIPATFANRKVHDGSSLTREWIVLNDTKCPIQLNENVGVGVVFKSSRFRFGSSGYFTTTEPITAYEVHHLLYDVFGDYLNACSETCVKDINGSIKMDQGTTWYGADHELMYYFLCVSYVATVRTQADTIWRFDPLAISEELKKIQIPYKEEYRPSTETEKN